jgi:hypothetical protein
LFHLCRGYIPCPQLLGTYNVSWTVPTLHFHTHIHC